MAIKGLVGGTNTTTTTVTASGNTTPAVTTEVNSTSTLSARLGATQTMSASAVSTTPVPVEYTGVESDSMYVTVNNTNRTISGEVKWRNMIATTEAEEDANHAYPANKARINFGDIETKFATINRTLTTLSNSCTSAHQNVSQYVEELQQVQVELGQLIQDCSNLNLNLTRESLARERKDTELQGKISDTKTQLDSSFENLQTVIYDRLNAQDNKISKNSVDVENETARAQEEESKLSRSIQNTTKALLITQSDLTQMELRADSISDRVGKLENSGVVAKVGEHTQDIGDLKKQLTNVNMKLTSNVDTVTDDVSRISDIVYKHDSKITSVESEVKEATSDLRDMKTTNSRQDRELDAIEQRQQNEEETRNRQFISLSAMISGETEVRRSVDELHASELDRLEVRISTLQTRLFEIIENLGNELRARDEDLANNIQNVSYAFVDAGTAPI